MHNEETIHKLKDMKLYTMAQDLEHHLERGTDDGLSFWERIGMMVDHEWSDRQERRLQARLKRSKLREAACVEEINYRHSRGLDKSVMQRLVACKWLKFHENIIFSGPTGVGKTWLACALAQKACREGYTSFYVRVPRLLHDLFLSRADGSYPKLMAKLSKPDVLILDDFGLAPLSETERRDLFEVVEERHGRRSTIITSQLAVKYWHELIGDPTIADAILDRLTNNAHRVELMGDSLRPKNKKKGGK